MKHLNLLTPLLLVVFWMIACSTKVSDQGTVDTVRVASAVETIEKNFLIGKISPASDPRFVKLADEHTSGSAKGGYLLKETYDAFIKMAAAAKEVGYTLKIVASTRTFDEQKPIWESKWNGKVPIKGATPDALGNPQKKAELILRISSMPGTSRYHWGTDIAINSMDENYFLTSDGEKVYRWLSTEAAKFGFCQPYTSKGSGRTGYEEAKWQWSYLPKAEFFLMEYRAQVKPEDITGFAGSEVAMKVNIFDNYVSGVECTLLIKYAAEGGRQGIKIGDRIVINPDDYIEILDYSEGLIAVKSESAGWGFADTNGKLVIPCQYASVGSFTKGKALINLSGDTPDWRNTYEYIDKQGNKLGKFFVPLNRTSKCEQGFLVGSNLSGEPLAGYTVSNCPDGKMSYTYRGWEWGSAGTYYPNTNIASVIADLATQQAEHANIFKKFNGESAEFKEGESTVTISVTRNTNGSLQKVQVSISSDFFGANYTFSTENDGVLLNNSYGS